MKLLRIQFFSIYFILISQALPGQDIENMIANELDGVRNGSINAYDYKFNSLNEKRVLIFLKKYESDPDLRVRSRVQILKAKISLQSKDTLVRQMVVEDFLKDAASENQEISQYSIARLLTFKENDFSLSAKNKIPSIFDRIANRDFILICGTAQIKQLVPKLKKIASEFDRTRQDWFSTRAWCASLSLTRMGYTEKLDTLITAVELELNPILRVSRLLKDLAYTKNPDAIKILRKYLESNQKIPDVMGPGRDLYVNQYAMEYLAQYIDDFPIKERGIGYSPEEIETAKSFLNKKYGREQY